LLKNLSTGATVAGIVKNILKLTQTFGIIHTSCTGHKAATTALNFEALSKYCKWSVCPVCFEIFTFLGMSANPKLTFDSTLYQLAAQVWQSAKCTAHLCLLMIFYICSYLLILQYRPVVQWCVRFDAGRSRVWLGRVLPRRCKSVQ